MDLARENISPKILRCNFLKLEIREFDALLRHSAVSLKQPLKTNLDPRAGHKYEKKKFQNERIKSCIV